MEIPQNLNDALEELVGPPDCPEAEVIIFQADEIDELVTPLSVERRGETIIFSTTDEESELLYKWFGFQEERKQGAQSVAGFVPVSTPFGACSLSIRRPFLLDRLNAYR